jgi:thiol-disulfide isomerase/thioredoxin
MNKVESQPSGNRPWLYLAGAFVVFWVFYLVFFGPRRRAPLEYSAKSVPADFDWSLRDLDDRVVSFARFKGKAVFLNIWATWCGPCVGEMPSIAQLAKEPRLAGKGIQFVCVSTDDSSEKVQRFLEGKDWSMTFLRAETLPDAFRTEGIPATFLIAPDGWIAASEIGATDWHEPRVVAFLEKLAGGSAGAR